AHGRGAASSNLISIAQRANAYAGAANHGVLNQRHQSCWRARLRSRATAMRSGRGTAQIATTCGAASTSSGGATMASNTCWAMWAANNSSLSVSSGEGSAAKSTPIAIAKQRARVLLGERERRIVVVQQQQVCFHA